ncbi:hypothetical protein [Ottowia thiooxydans]|uniref:hypothetical protein n=1 Tax=Ottowia thiooxydans TaxID=219182 RepID=UPI00146C0CDC|nr:hypothetical protein [Ottowia thiooxydans]
MQVVCDVSNFELALTSACRDENHIEPIAFNELDLSFGFNHESVMEVSVKQ